MSGHAPTPGPWSHNTPWSADIAGPDGNDLAVAISKDMQTLTIPCGAPTVGPRTRMEAYANARLISAAPDLLEACLRAFEQTDRIARPNDWETLRAAIAKATGNV